MNLVTIWHNPRCSKSREAMQIIEDNGCEKEIVEYLKVSPNAQDLKEVLTMLNLDPRKLMRTKETIYKELNLKDELNEDKLIEAMVQNPILIERPVIFKDNKAIIGRPTSIIADFIKD